ncbi:general transcription factor IIH subunit 1-like isoform X2 [Drosophila busckii]|nr:general transcription factor IIH subunit 1-like isoform X2 [Drosophila busckii]
MVNSSEVVLLQMGEVCYKNNVGTLYVTTERLGWVADHDDNKQKISSEGKVTLQIALYEWAPTFHFVNSQGRAAMLADRNKAKNVIMHLVANFNRQLEQENRLLVENPYLLQLYKDLVVTKLLTSDEFWAAPSKNVALKKMGITQEIGVYKIFLADIMPGFNSNQKSDVMHSIFEKYPDVKNQHIENVYLSNLLMFG